MNAALGVRFLAGAFFAAAFFAGAAFFAAAFLAGAAFFAGAFFAAAFFAGAFFAGAFFAVAFFAAAFFAVAMIISFWKLINHQCESAFPLALRMLLEKKPVSKRKMAFFTLACRFFTRAFAAFSL
jgi:hypothetical protein